ncbi:uncharacterized protein LOC119385077 [Rhipicephalus sanguineus]|uniref:uncharacterized protein LOC119385077 n=1 Tax=Rhipicephalus sanguineus TaxID=34632 RepID=UPI0020C3F821|nr:uncharacterized protein LOC119385077 [Rhipicephalus sanguineus]
MTEGPSPDNLTLIMGDDPTEKIANFVYTDYKTCAVTRIPYKNSESCILWVNRKGLNDIPQQCVDQYEDNCDLELTAFDKGTCSGVLPNQ